MGKLECVRKKMKRRCQGWVNDDSEVRQTTKGDIPKGIYKDTKP